MTQDKDQRLAILEGAVLKLWLCMGGPTGEWENALIFIYHLGEQLEQEDKEKGTNRLKQ